MSLSIIILTGLFYLVPGMVDMPYRYTLHSGNMGLNGLYLDIMSKRNMVYFSILFLSISLFLPYDTLKTILFINLLYCLYIYFTTIDKWYPYIT